jgi:hypothetical protein
MMRDSSDILAMGRIDRGTPSDLLVALYLVLAITNSLVMTSVPRRLLVLVGVLLLAYEAIGFRSMKYEQMFLYLLGVWIALGVTLNGMIFGEWWQESVYLPGNLGVALALCRGHVRRHTTIVVFYAAAAYFAYRLVTVGSPAAIHHILVNGSANGISELMLILCGLHYVVTLMEGRRIRLLPAVLCLLVSALTLGRSGMAAAALLLLGVAVHDLVRETNRRLLAVKLILYGSVAVLAVIVVLPRLELISFVFERFSEYGLSSEGRGRIWGAYGDAMNGLAPLVGHGREELFAGYINVHSSYILWHKAMGVMAVPLYCLAALALVWAAVRDWLLFVILTSLLLRASFDETILPFRLYDFLFYYLVCTVLVTFGSRREPHAPFPRPVEA